MVKAFEAYQESLLPKTTTEGGATKAEGRLKAAAATQKKIEALAPGSLSAAEKEALKTALEGLKGAAELLLAAMAKPVLRQAKKTAK